MVAGAGAISNGMKKLLLVAVAVAVLVGGGAFYGGMKYAQARRGYLPAGRQDFANLTPEQRQQFQANAGGGFRAGQGAGYLPAGRQGMGGMFVAGEIISKDDKSITIKLQNGGSKIVFYSDATEVGKSVSGTSVDLEIGKTVTTSGTTNSDGSITAQSIQIRPIPTGTLRSQ